MSEKFQGMGKEPDEDNVHVRWSSQGKSEVTGCIGGLLSCRDVELRNRIRFMTT